MSLLFAGHILTNIASPDNVPQNLLYWAMHPVLGGPDMIELPGGAEVPAATSQDTVRYWLELDNGSFYEVPLLIASMDHSTIEGTDLSAALTRGIIATVAPSVLTAPVDPAYELPVYHETPLPEMPAQWVPFFYPAAMGPLPDEYALAADEPIAIDGQVQIVGAYEDVGPYPIYY